MTRFARSKGSKASNERVEEEATPWEELKSTMAPPPSKKFKYNVEDIEDDNIENGEVDEENSEQSSDESEAEQETNKFIENEKKVQEEPMAAAEPEVLKKKRKRSQNKCLNCKQPGHLKRECPDLSEERRKELQDLVQMKVERKGERKLEILSHSGPEN